MQARRSLTRNSAQANATSFLLPASSTITTIAGSAAAGSSGDGGAATAATLRGPAGIMFDSGGNLLIADLNNNLLRRVDTNGNINTIASTPVSTGTLPAGYNGDATARGAVQAEPPAGIAVGPNCSVLIADMLNQRIRQLWPAVEYTITTNPAGLQIVVDAQKSTTPSTVSWLPGTTHQIDAPGTQTSSTGTRYVSAGPQSVSVLCGTSSVTINPRLNGQYLLKVNRGQGGVVSASTGWNDSGAVLTLTATPNPDSPSAAGEGPARAQMYVRLRWIGRKTIDATFHSGSGSTRRYPIRRH